MLDNYAPSANFSDTLQKFINQLYENADRLFSIGWLRKRLWQEVQKQVTAIEAGENGHYREAFYGGYEQLFAFYLTRYYRQSLTEIESIVINKTGDTNLIDELLIKRTSEIRELSYISFAYNWNNLRDNDVAWRKLAHKIPFSNSIRHKEIKQFFCLIDSISIITDIICGRGDWYGIHIDASDIEAYKQRKVKKMPSDEVLTKALIACSSFITKQSEWAAVYCLLRDEYGYDKKPFIFIKLINNLKLPEKMPKCPKDSFYSSFRDNSFLRDNIKDWDAKEPYLKIVLAVKEAIEKEL